MSKRTAVFISYSHEDKEWLEKLQNQIQSLEILGVIKPWDDTKIGPGSKWNTEINLALASARIAILLVSKDFLDSEFITSVELPILLKSSQKNKVIILTVLIDDSVLENSPLNEFQAINFNEPLNTLSESGQTKILLRVATAIADALKPQPHLALYMTMSVLFFVVALVTLRYNCVEHELIIASDIFPSEVYVDDMLVGTMTGSEFTYSVCEGNHKVSIQSGSYRDNRQVTVVQDVFKPIVHFNYQKVH
jgi:hypothetical protein